MRYSQNNEQEIILEYLRGQVGTFLDLGANDGVTLSNTRALAEIGWSGVLIEASPKAFKRLQANYPDPTKYHLYNFAIGSFNGIVEFNESGSLLGNDDVALVSTLNESEMNRFKKVVHYEKVEAKCLTWETFIHGCPVKHFDFVSMDIEGNELEVLPFMDLSKTYLLVIEWNGRYDLKAEYEKYLKGFTLIHTNGENLIYGR
jgi:FkbM family methyltransferase